MHCFLTPWCLMVATASHPAHISSTAHTFVPSCSRHAECAGSGEARRQVDEAGLLAHVHHLVASTNPPAVAAGGATAALLQATALLPYAGFAVTAKPSVNLLVLLQVHSLFAVKLQTLHAGACTTPSFPSGGCCLRSSSKSCLTQAVPGSSELCSTIEGCLGSGGTPLMHHMVRHHLCLHVLCQALLCLLVTKHTCLHTIACGLQAVQCETATCQ